MYEHSGQYHIFYGNFGNRRFCSIGCHGGDTEKDGYFRYLCAGRGDGGGRRYDQGCDPWEIAFGSGKPGVCCGISDYVTGDFCTALYQT